MARMKILNQSDQEAFDKPPLFRRPSKRALLQKLEIEGQMNNGKMF
ncbi:MAG: hypothetical protein Q8Q56_02120 [Alphaproteobacteria bacterium]|nr:hypothetical protein [Alphaproteobacteria bacterium]